MATARNRGIDRIRRERMAERKSAELGRELELREEDVERDLAAELDDPFEDDLLRLVFTTCHPVLSTDARVALTLRLLGGLTTPEIARAYLVSEATVAQRIARAKRTLSAARVPIEAPERDAAPGSARLGPRGDLPDLQRGLLAELGRGGRPHRAARGGAPARTHPRRAPARRAGGPRPRRADGAPGVADAGPESTPPATRCRCSSRTAPAGTGCSSAAATGRSPGPTRPAARSGPTRCRPRSPPATARPDSPATPTGSGSPRSTTGSPRSRLAGRRPQPGGRLRDGLRPDVGAGLLGDGRCGGRSPPIRCCRPSAATCSSGPAGTGGRGRVRAGRGALRERAPGRLPPPPGSGEPLR